MTFVYPLLLGGLLLAGLPVLLHFLIRQKPKTLLFPAFQFLLQKRRTNTRNLRLRHFLLLLLRIALIALLCFALARPRMFSEQLGISRERPVALVLIFDTSPSMEYKSGDETRLDLAKKRSLELLDLLPEDCRVLILDASEPTNFAREDWLKSLDKARQRIQGLTTRPDNAPVTKAVGEALRRFDDWDRTGDDPEGAKMPRFVCVFSDRTRASWDANAGVKQKEDAPPVQMLYFDVGIDDPVDLAITHLELPANRQAYTQGERIDLRAVVMATGKEAKNTLLVVIDGKQKAAQSFNVEAGKQQTVTMPIDTAGWAPGRYQAEVKFETEIDALSFNNARFVTFQIRDKAKVLVLADDLKATHTFAKALDAHLYAVDHQSVQQKADFADYKAVFLVSVKAPTDDLWKKLATYVDQGGNVGIVPPGKELDKIAYNSEAAQKVMPAEVSEIVQAPKPGTVWNVGRLDLKHSFLQLYTQWLGADREYNIIGAPGKATKFWGFVKPRDEDIVVRYDHQDAPAILARQAKGKVLTLTTPMDERTPTWNNYGSSPPFYLALTLLCARYLCEESAETAFNFQFGLVPPTFTKSVGYATFVLLGPNASDEISFDDKNRWIADRLPRPGNYLISGTNPGETKTLHHFSINIPGAESDLTRVPIEEIEAVLGNGALVHQDRRTSVFESLNWNEPLELFPWLMILLLFFLALENLLANRFYRQDSESPLAA